MFRLRTVVAVAANFAIFAAALVGSAPQALADIDYRCLKDCIASGSSTSRCLSLTCFYTSAPHFASADQQSRIVSANRQFEPPVPIPTTSLVIAGPQPKIQMLEDPMPLPAVAPVYATPGIMLTPTSQALGPSTNYKCQSLCLQRSYQFDMCKAMCSY